MTKAAAARDFLNSFRSESDTLEKLAKQEEDVDYITYLTGLGVITAAPLTLFVLSFIFWYLYCCITCCCCKAENS